ncbi:MAD2L1-binding protein-like [Uloborus diversus]|uniref:MAD2L1-binding protein-like n=1 Tax=Uloborus diversus TaxID=327109 RepID=UPI00240A43C9|nr:MAD2L1-binding protein-like [Uloborus diversus]
MSECCITFPGPVSRSTICHLVIDYLKYVLYYRGQFPLPLEQMKQSLGRNSNSHNPQSSISHQIYNDDPDERKNSQSFLPLKISSKDMRKKQLFVETVITFDKFFDNLSRTLQNENVLEVVLNLGANMMRPKELYRVTLPLKCSNPECKQDYASLQRCRIHFFKDILQSSLWEDLTADSTLPISILLLLGPGVSLSEYMEQKCFYAVPKHCKQRTIRFPCSTCGHCSESLSEDGRMVDSLVDSKDSTLRTRGTGLWVKMKSNLRGFKHIEEVNQ